MFAYSVGGQVFPNQMGRFAWGANKFMLKTFMCFYYSNVTIFKVTRRRRNDKNSLRQSFSDFYGPLVRPPGGWKGVNCPKLLSLYFLGKSDGNKNATFHDAVFPVLQADNKISRWVPC